LIYNSGKVENLGKINKSDTANRILDFVRNNMPARKDQIIIPRVSAEIAASRFN
jgi:hypothetical protein